MDNAGNTVLHLAVSMNDVAFASLLLLKGADPNTVNRGGITPTIIARRMKFKRLIKVLKKHGGKVPPEEEKIAMSLGAPVPRRKSTKKGLAANGGDMYSQPKSMLLTGSSKDLLLDGGMTPETTLADVHVPGDVPQTPTSPLPSPGGVTEANWSELERPADLLYGFQAFPTSSLPIYNAAYLGLGLEAIETLPLDILNAHDEVGSTALMKASLRGHLPVVKALLLRGANVDLIDYMGNTALVWAALGGNLDVVKTLANHPGISLDGKTQPMHDDWGYAYPVTPLAAAGTVGHTAVMEHLIDAGANINHTFGPNGSRTALMCAAWMRREEAVRLLMKRGAHVPAEAENWLRKGFIYLKRAALDTNAWSGSPGAFARIMAAGGSGGISAESTAPLTINTSTATLPRTRRMSLKDKMSYFSSEEYASLTALEAIMTDSSSPPAFSMASINKSNNSLQAVSENESSASGSNGDLLSAGSGTPRARQARNGNRNRFRHGMNLDKLIGQNPEIIAQLTERVPDRGTELDALWVQVFQHVIQLLIAANQNRKTQFIVISANAIHHAGEIVRAIESLEKSLGAPSTATNSSIRPFSPIGTSGFPVLAATPDSSSSMFASTAVRARIKDLTKMVNNDLPKQLMLTTRIAIGVWPPQHAMSDMIKAANELGRTCRELTDIANMTGLFPVLDKVLELQFSTLAAEEDSGSGTTAAPKDAPAEGTAVMASLSYEEYKRQNDLKVLEEISKQSASVPDAGPSEHRNELSDTEQVEEQRRREQLLDEQFFGQMDQLLLSFVEVMKEIKQAYQNHLKHQYVSLTSTAAHRAEVLIDEIRGYELFANLTDDLMFDNDDAAVLAAKGIATNGFSFPVSVADIWFSVLQEVRNAARNVTMKGKLASGVMPPPNAADEMVRSTIPCLVAVKKLVVIGKEAARKIRRQSFDKVTKRDRWARDVAQNEHVKQLFQLWEAQVLRPQRTYDDEGPAPVAGGAAAASVATSAEPGAEELGMLKDDWEGLVFEPTGDKVAVKGGRLTKLVEWMTSAQNTDPEFVVNFLLTHHSFTTTSELLDLLFRRYSFTAPPALTRAQYDVFLQRKVFPVKRSVCAVLQTWVSILFEEDFTYGSHVGVFKLRDFCEGTVAKDSEVWKKELMGLVERKLNEVTNPPALLSTPTPTGPTPKLPKLPPETDINTLLTANLLYQDLDPIELARQLAIQDLEHFAKIKPHECLDQIWGDKRRKEMGTKDVPVGPTGLGDMIKHTNIVTMWIANCIIRNEDLKARREALRYFAQMAVHCQELNNFNGITALNAAMSNAAVNRLHKTWEAFREKYPKLHEAYLEASSTVSPKGQYANYRKVLKELVPPAVPFLGRYLLTICHPHIFHSIFTSFHVAGVSLTDLTFMELGNPDFLPDTSLINFDKRRKVYQILTGSIQKFQQQPYNLIVVPGIRDFLSGLSNLQLLNDDELYEMSLKVEKKEEELSDEGEEDGDG
ncbi:ras guanine nucleotide exchange factor domain-containing protein [Fimicolochytrium jonesii]|uniref:ras guanine nucleotide exchange factor domain-containing protein n=1 Tax=Fimicolochytrium jonesii TaxID=1396493 RepID=UPI0022FDCA53|nr:ras guanine nucleotide exchange factor domain-containing protein [Fimicolochytrium jonesii]KAI8823022.1 ras guanine nucleotide exchange factor domain-containing protein [Fimicolochytrium jonesii]